MSSSPPAVVADRYRLIAPLGQGGMGRVWRATDVVLHRDVAIKELVPPPGLTPGERQEMRERSLREARAIARLNNVNVVRVFDVLRTDADPWIVMEYVPSRSLQDTLAAEGPFHPIRAAEIGLGVLGALRAAHRAGVVHRDVKPGNVLIGADGRVVLTDFGLATVPGDPNVTRTGLVLGSPAYIAPERAREGTAGPAADLWSLGATLYAAVEGASPFARPSAIATLAALATENPPPARNAGPLKPVLNGLLRKDPSHRINAEEAERLLNRAAGRRSKLAFPMSPTMRRPGVARDRLGAMGPTGAAPVVPGPRPPVAPARPVEPPGRPPLAGGRPAVGGGRPPVYVPGKAPVGRSEPDRPTRVDAPRLDATRVDAPPVRDEKTTKFFGTRDRSTTASGQPAGSPPVRPSAPSANPATNTSRGGPGSFTAADVAANRRRKAAPEHERSLADATALAGHADTAPADPTTVVRTPTADATTVVGGPTVDATTVVGPLITPADPTTVVRTPATPAEPTTVVRTPATPADATTVVPAPSKKKAKAQPPRKKQPETKPATARAATEKAEPEAKSAAPAETPPTKRPAQAEPAEATPAQAAPAEATADKPAKADDKPKGNDTGKSEMPADAVRVPLKRPTPPATEPETDSDEPPAGPEDAALGTSEPAVDASEPETAADKPEAAADKPEATAVEPGATVDKPEATAVEPETAAVEPETAADKPEAVADDHALDADTHDEPANEPAVADNEPAPGADEPALASHQPTSAPDDSAPDPDDLAPISPAINRSTRPAWRPMEVRPSPRPGITLFGTRLTYPQAGIGGAIVLIVLVLLIVLAVQAFGSDDTAPTRPNAAPTATVKPTAKGSTGGRPSNGASATPSSTPTTRPPASSAPSGFTLPAGWRMYTQPATSNAPAFTIPIPNNAEIKGGQGVSVRFRWNNRLLIVDRTTTPQADAFQDLKDKEAAGSNKGGYSLLKIQPVKYRDYDSTADWEYLYTADSGNPQHVVRRNIRVDAHSAYMLSWYVSPEDWGPSQAQLQALYQGFQPG